jgi:hypothetical protein
MAYLYTTFNPEVCSQSGAYLKPEKGNISPYLRCYFASNNILSNTTRSSDSSSNRRNGTTAAVLLQVVETIIVV